MALAGISCASKAQDIATIAKSDPLVITGAIGTQNTYYNSSYGSGYASPLSNSIYANLNFNIYGMSMPFSFYWSNDNTSFSYPQISFNISPTYKGWTLHLGQRSMAFSSYTYNIPFNGIGLEYKKQKGFGLRFGAFYGVLKRAVNYDPDEISTRTPQYRRTGWGAKVGFGNSKSYVDLFFFRAKDHLSSIDECWYDQLNSQDNLVIGAKGRLAIGEHVSLTANFATSVLSTDTRSEIVSAEEAQRFDKIFDVRYSSIARFAGDATISGYWKYLSASLSYKLIQPNYASLGLSYISNNYQSLAASVSTHIGNLSLSGNFSGQSDNVSGEQLYTTHGYVYSASASLPVNNNLHLSASYNGYRQMQSDGTAQVTDSTKVDRRMDNFAFMPSYMFGTPNANHSISVSSSYTSNKDLNKFSTGVSDVKTLAVGGGYNLMVAPIETSFGANYSHQQSEGYNTEYMTDIYSLSVSRSFLEGKTLSTSATISYTCNSVKDQTKNNSLGGMVSASYTLKEVHNFSFSVGYNKYASVNIVADGYNDDSYNFQCSLSYNYSFTLLRLKKKGEGVEKRIESDFIRKKKEVKQEGDSKHRH